MPQGQWELQSATGVMAEEKREAEEVVPPQSSGAVKGTSKSVRAAAKFMDKQLRQIALVFFCVALVCPLAANAQMPLPPAPRRPAPVTNVTVDGSEAMFTTMCALLAAGFEANVSAEDWHPLRARLREQMQHQQGPAVDALREF